MGKGGAHEGTVALSAREMSLRSTAGLAAFVGGGGAQHVLLWQRSGAVRLIHCDGGDSTPRLVHRSSGACEQQVGGVSNNDTTYTTIINYSYVCYYITISYFFLVPVYDRGRYGIYS